MEWFDLIKIIIVKILSWPFLLFILMLLAGKKFSHQISSWIVKVTEFELGDGKLKFKIGNEEVPLDKLDSTITDRLRELESKIEELSTRKTDSIGSYNEDDNGEIPQALASILEHLVYDMLNSKLWLGRYVYTIAQKASVTEDTVIAFCKSRSDITLFKDGDNWVAALTKRMQSHV